MKIEFSISVFWQRVLIWLAVLAFGCVLIYVALYLYHSFQDLRFMGVASAERNCLGRVLRRF